MQINLYNCWEEEVAIAPGQLNEIGGKYAVISLVTAAQALKEGKIHGLVTAPIHKKNTQVAEFNFTGHTPSVIMKTHEFAQYTAIVTYSVRKSLAFGVEHNERTVEC